MASNAACLIGSADNAKCSRWVMMDLFAGWLYIDVQVLNGQLESSMEEQ